MPVDLVNVLIRWIHFLAGITWIGLLYYLNLVNVRMMASLDAGIRPQLVQANVKRVMAWFRHSAWVTVLAGLLLIWLLYWQRGDVISSDNAKTILIGGILGILMMLNVWFIIWPNQRRIIQAAEAGQAADPSWARMALFASRANFTLSFPMLFFMGGASHFPMDWILIIVVGIIAAIIGFLVVYAVQRWYAPSF
ncbi:MAG: hypothetical protein GEU73_01915 [Chloroflexi bacterium]|nr:hypothetical protein [Chloroflexota bacterium]